ncbi:MAG: hypothetical protein CMO73_00435 [Verrucomicrobiales bacterium]|nr:hypothetical protein [Verrucomicrobiales bacterium]HAA87973.1 hypothetical protein [Verrucomicrobiales bacterium]
MVYFISPAGAHPVHATFAEAVWNPKTQSIEIALRVRVVDLESALSKKIDKQIDIENTEGVEKDICSYLNKNFYITLPTGKKIIPKWLDKEVGITNAWLYFEFILGAETMPKQCKIQNSIFFDDLEGQKNVIEYREGKKKGIFSFNKDTKTRSLILDE